MKKIIFFLKFFEKKALENNKKMEVILEITYPIPKKFVKYHKLGKHLNFLKLIFFFEKKRFKRYFC